MGIVGEIKVNENLIRTVRLVIIESTKLARFEFLGPANFLNVLVRDLIID
jgi:hypothetical protein